MLTRSENGMEAGGFRTRTTVSEGSKTNAVADNWGWGRTGRKEK